MKFAWISAVLVCLASINSADAGLLFHHRSNDCGCAAPAACAPVASPACAAPAPTCCNTSCDRGCCKRRCGGLLSKILSCRKCRNNCGCAQTSCAAPAACAPAAAPTCCAPAPTNCGGCCQKKKCCWFKLPKLFSCKKCNTCGCAQTTCAAPAAVAPTCCAPAPTTCTGCNSCGHKKCSWLSKLFHHKKSCCQTNCGSAPATCAAPVACGSELAAPPVPASK